jgi:hypothetical protein
LNKVEHFDDIMHKHLSEMMKDIAVWSHSIILKVLPYQMTSFQAQQFITHS